MECPLEMRYLRPIFLLASLYMLVDKVLAAKLARDTGKLISLEQSAFIRGRHLVGFMVALNKVLNLAKRSKRESFYI